MLNRRVFAAIVIILFCLPISSFAYVDCDSLDISPDDSLYLVDMTADPGDIVWVPLNLTNTQNLAGFIAYMRYDSTFLTPVENPDIPGSIWAQPKGRLETSLYYEPDAFWVLPSQNPEDSGGLVIAFNGLSPVTAPDIAPGSGTICWIPFELNPAAPIGSMANVWFHQINEMYINGVDTFYADCRRTNFAVGNGGVDLVWPTTVGATVTAVVTPVAEVTLDHVVGLRPGIPTSIDCEQSPVEFHLRINNQHGSSIWGQTNGFEIYSPQGASFTIDGLWNPAVDWSDYWAGGQFVSIYADGVSPDTIGFGTMNIGVGYPTGHSDIAWIISVDVSCDDIAKSICIDSAFYPPGGVWLWSTSPAVIPDWDGPHCFRIGGAPPGVTRIVLDHVDGTHPADPSLLDCSEGLATFNMLWENQSGGDATGTTNGFRSYSPDGAGHTVDRDTASTNWNYSLPLSSYWDGGIFVGIHAGVLADSVKFGNFRIMAPGYPSGQSDIMFWFSVFVDCADAGKTLCIDSSFVQAGATWLWSTTAGGVIPAWSGPHCWEIWQPCNCAPYITYCPQDLYHDHCSAGPIQFDFDGEDLNNYPIYFRIVSGPGEIDSLTGIWTYQPTPADAGQTLNLEVEVCTEFVCNITPCQTLVHITNEPPLFTSGCGETIFAPCRGVATHQLTADPVDCDPYWFQLVDVTPTPTGTIVLDSATGAFSFDGKLEDCYLSFTVTVSVTDGINTTECQFAVEWIGVEATGVVIEKTHGTIQGSHETVDLTYISGTELIAGFDFLIAYDASALTFTGATEGSVYANCDWEYFTYRYGADGNCDGGCPSGMLRIVGLAETNNGPSHPSCYSLSPGDTFATLDFLVSNDRTLECQYVPIRFFWLDCGDNSLSSKTGDSLFVAWHIYDFEGNLLWDEGDNLNFPESDRIPYLGVPDVCFNPDPSKPRAIMFADFWNGGIDIVCADSIDARGDINLNEVPNEIADAVLFSNYFVYGIGVFTANVAGQMAASDVNADGLTLTVADLVYLIRVITGDALPYAKLSPTEVSWRHQDNIFTVDYEIGAAHLILQGNQTPELLTDRMEMRYNFDGENTRVIIYSLEQGVVMSGEIVRTNGAVLSIEMATYEGAPVIAKEVPVDWALYQNYPNPFNPITTISFDLRNPSHFSLEIINLTGQRVDIFSGDKPAGQHSINFDASGLASGVYFYKLSAGGFTQTRKMVLLK